MVELPTMEKHIKKVCAELTEILLEKNKAYGNSVADPIKIFCKLTNVEQVNVRIDDKISRILRGTPYQNEDTEFDLIGYLILKRVLVAFNLDQHKSTEEENE